MSLRPIYLCCLGECCNAISLWHSRNVLWKLHPTFHRHRGECIMTELSFLSEPLLLQSRAHRLICEMFLKWEDESESVTGFCLFIIITDGSKEWEHVDGVQWGLWILWSAMEPRRAPCSLQCWFSHFRVLVNEVFIFSVRQTNCMPARLFNVM